ncbi:MAG: hypothetical protein JJE04_21190 [Acidobacteriia bacterium]|nr:hypothetical protein [Terriglobia bacterium]
MRVLWPILLLASVTVVSAQQPPPRPADPKLLSIHPFAGQAGTSFTVTVRGTGIKTATSVQSDLEASVEAVDQEAPPAPGSRRTPSDLVRLKITSAPDAKPGRHNLRLITPGGISNALPIHLTPHAVVSEPDGIHETPETAIPVPSLPTTFTGRITAKGESDFFVFEAHEGQTITFSAASGLPGIGSAGSNANGFDPSLALYELGGSWFDPARIRRVAFNDEPLWFFGRHQEPHLVHRFQKTGKYYLRLEAFSGQGGPDYSYRLDFFPRETQQDRPPADPSGERGFSRLLSTDRLNQLAERGGKPRDRKSVETYNPGPVQLPAIIEGAIAEPGQSQRAHFQIDGPRDIAIEIQTPSADPPLFNPVVRLLDSRGEEVATNILVGRGACTGAMSKSIQAKVIVPIRNPGAYTVEVRDLTADLGDPSFRYRLMIRQQIPHLGNIGIDEDHINLFPGDAKTTRVTFDREEDFRGAVAITVESLPPGVQALPSADYEPDKDAPLTAGKRERFNPRTERAVIAFTADPTAPPTTKPAMARVVVRPIVDGKPGAVAASKQIPIMVVPQP